MSWLQIIFSCKRQWSLSKRTAIFLKRKQKDTHTDEIWFLMKIKAIQVSKIENERRWQVYFENDRNSDHINYRRKETISTDTRADRTKGHCFKVDNISFLQLFKYLTQESFWRIWCFTSMKLHTTLRNLFSITCTSWWMPHLHNFLFGFLDNGPQNMSNLQRVPWIKWFAMNTKNPIGCLTCFKIITMFLLSNSPPPSLFSLFYIFSPLLILYLNLNLFPFRSISSFMNSKYLQMTQKWLIINN